MSQGFKDRYILRSEHQEIVDFYRKLVAQLHVKVCEARSHVDAQSLDQAIDHAQRLTERREARAALTDRGNVIRIDFRRQGAASDRH
jgi:hypothetical protein